jgi:hypothetical protein
MNITIAKYKIIVLTGMLFCLSASCKKFIEAKPPIDQLTTSEVFSDDASAETAMRGLYIQMKGGNTWFFANGGMTLYTGLTGDELVNRVPSTTYDPYAKNALLSTDFNISNYIWLDAYKFIYQTNALIENVQVSSSLSAPVKQQITGEAKFVRAFCHFYLFNLFGPIPLATTTDYKVTSTLPRADSATVYAQIILDLKDAAQLLTDAYASDDKGRPNKWAAIALLNRVYLYTGDWKDAAEGAASVMNSGLYALDSLNAVYLSTSDEAILQLTPASLGDNTAEGFNFVPSSPTTRPAYIINPYMLNAFEPGDERRTAWIDSATIGGSTYYYPYKYKVRSSTPAEEYYILLRLGEQYLIQAEAYAQEGDLPQAIAAVDVIRTRAGLPTIAMTDPGINQQDLLQVIYHEDQIEFFAEWGHRWFDLKRTGRINQVLGMEKSSVWQPTDAYYPIPNSEILSNPRLTQNEGY